MRRFTFSAPLAQRSAPQLCLLLLAVLPWLAAAEAEGQTISPPKPPPGSATPWSPPERFDPDNIPKTDGPEEAKERLRSLKCHIREIEELGRLFVEDAIDRSHYWIQLPDKVKIRAADPASFDGRKKLKLEDLSVGQRLLVTVRTRDEEILKVEVRPPAAPEKTRS